MKPIVVGIALLAAGASIVVGMIAIRARSTPSLESRAPTLGPPLVHGSTASLSGGRSFRPVPATSATPTGVDAPAQKSFGSPTDSSSEVSFGRVSGRILDDLRQPIERAAVLVVGEDPFAWDDDCFGRLHSTSHATTDAAGRWAMTILENRTIPLRMSKAGFAPRVVPDFAYSSGDNLDIGDVVLGDGATISGSVVDRRGHRVDGIRIAVTRENDSADAVTDVGGAFALEGLQSGENVSVRVADDRFVVSGGHEAFDVVAPTDDIRFVVERRFRLRVIIVDDANGEPLASGWARVLNPRGAMVSSKRESSERGSVVDFGNDLAPDTYDLVAGSRGFEPSEPSSIEIEPDVPREVTVRLAHRRAEANGSLRVTAVDERGRSVRPIRVSVAPRVDWGDPAARKSIDWTAMLERTAEGDDELVDLPPAEYTVDVTACDDFHQPAHAIATIAPGLVTSIAVNLPATGRLVVDVLDSDGARTISSGAIVLRDADGRFVAASFRGARISGSSDADGEWIGPRVATHIRPDVYSLTIRGRGDATRTATAIVHAGETSVVEVRFDGEER